MSAEGHAFKTIETLAHANYVHPYIARRKNMEMIPTVQSSFPHHRTQLPAQRNAGRRNAGMSDSPRAAHRNTVEQVRAPEHGARMWRVSCGTRGAEAGAVHRHTIFWAAKNVLFYGVSEVMAKKAHGGEATGLAPTCSVLLIADVAYQEHVDV